MEIRNGKKSETKYLETALYRLSNRAQVAALA